jgi:hypothetical protein
VDGSGYIYIADGFTAVIRKVTASTGIIAWLRRAWVGVFSSIGPNVVRAHGAPRSASPAAMAGEGSGRAMRCFHDLGMTADMPESHREKSVLINALTCLKATECDWRFFARASRSPTDVMKRGGRNVSRSRSPAGRRDSAPNAAAMSHDSAGESFSGRGDVPHRRVPACSSSAACRCRRS